MHTTHTHTQTHTQTQPVIKFCRWMIVIQPSSATPPPHIYISINIPLFYTSYKSITRTHPPLFPSLSLGVSLSLCLFHCMYVWFYERAGGIEEERERERGERERERRGRMRAGERERERERRERKRPMKGFSSEGIRKRFSQTRCRHNEPQSQPQHHDSLQWQENKWGDREEEKEEKGKT